jgi:hypothetical protein
MMDDPTGISLFAWKHEVADKEDPAMLFTCRLANGYKILAWAYNSDRRTQANLGIINFIDREFHIQIMRECDDIAQHTELHMTQTILYNAGDLPPKNDGLNARELYAILVSLKAKRLDADALTFSVIKARAQKCPACNGTGELDFGFYKRQCMDCYKG